MEQNLPQRATHGFSLILGMLSLALAAGAASTGFFSWRTKVYTPEPCSGCITSPPHIDSSFWDQAQIGPYGWFFFAFCAVLAATSLLYFPRFGGGGKIHIILAGIAQIILGLFGAVLMYLYGVLAQIGDYAPGIITFSPACYGAIACMLALVPLGIGAIVRGNIVHRV